MSRDKQNNRSLKRTQSAEVKGKDSGASEAKRDNSSPSLLKRINGTLPAILESYELGRQAASVGFDWPDANGVLDKITEELVELRVELRRMPQPDRNKLEEEAGDLLFTAANLAQRLNLDPEHCLRQANQKFRRRFQNMEQNARRQGRELGQCTMDELEALWKSAKESGTHGAQSCQSSDTRDK